MHVFLIGVFFALTLLPVLSAVGQTWTADNGNGTFSNPLFYDEFSDPDMIRVGEDFYLTGTTMHCMPGLPILHSKDLVNWDFVGYAFDRLDLGPEFRLENGGSIYGQGIWAPCFRFHNGTFYIFSNVNGRTTQLFTATNPAGPWTHAEMKKSFHDLSVLFDDDGKAYVVWGYGNIHLAQLTNDFTDIVPGTERIIIPKEAGLGEGNHFYKIYGKYFLCNDRFDGHMRMLCARADKLEGPYEVNPAISIDEEFGIAEGYRLVGNGKGEGFALKAPDLKDEGRLSMHQGGLVDTPRGEWWGFSMMDHNSIGRLTCLSPIVWQDGWPYFGLPGNLKRTPRTWVKPNTGSASEPTAPYVRSDDFAGSTLKPVWQWNHVPDDSKWSLTERPGFLRLHSLPASDFFSSRNTLTQRSIGPQSTATAELVTTGMQPGDVAGLALLNHPYAWIGVTKHATGLSLDQYDQHTGKSSCAPLKAERVWLRAACDFLTEKATFSYSTDGQSFQRLGDEFMMIFQIKTFQGVRYSLFHYNTGGSPEGFVDFDGLTVYEPYPNALTRPIPIGKTITLENMADGATLVVRGNGLTAVAPNDPAAHTLAAHFKVLDRKLGRVALQSALDGRLVTVIGLGDTGRVSLMSDDENSDAQSFQWTEMPRGDLLFLSLTSYGHLRIKPEDGTITADEPGARPDRKNGASFTWRTPKVSEIQSNALATGTNAFVAERSCTD